MSHGLPGVTLQSTRHKVILHGLREVTSECQVTSQGPSINGFNVPKWQEMHNTFIIGRHGVLLNSKLNHIELGSASVNMKFTVQ